ncbi:MAG: AraC family transcriptional regulator [Polyangiaceae bacterium]
MSEYLEQIQRGVDFIETRLDEDIQLPHVARVAGISQWHFQRIFKALTGETLKTYVRSRRLANSLDRLLTTQLRVLDIALVAGFESQESFARAFKKAFGLTPQEYRRLGDKSLFLKKVQFDADYLRHINQNVSLAPELYVQPRMTLVGMRTLFFSVDSEKNKLPADGIGTGVLWTHHGAHTHVQLTAELQEGRNTGQTAAHVRAIQQAADFVFVRETNDQALVSVIVKLAAASAQ